MDIRAMQRFDFFSYFFVLCGLEKPFCHWLRMRVTVLLNQTQATHYYVISLGERSVEGTHLKNITEF